METTACTALRVGRKEFCAPTRNSHSRCTPSGSISPGGKFLKPDIFSRDSRINAGFSLRSCGLLGLNSDHPDREAATQEFAREADFSCASVALSDQVHGSEVLWVTHSGSFFGYDGLVTDTPGIVLCVKGADCATILLDGGNGVIGAAHAGWRGARGGIITNTVRLMKDRGAYEGKIKAYISPCISTEAFEVGEEVAQQFSPEFVVRRTSWPRPHLDLKGVCLAELRANNVLDVEVSPWCTYSSDAFYSYRREGGTPGRQWAWIQMRTNT